MNAVFKIGLDSAQSRIGRRTTGERGVFDLVGSAVGRIKMDICLIGENSIHCNKDEMGVDFLFDAPLILGVKIFDDEDSFADLVQLLDAPSGMIDFDKILFGI